jgi:hypothetical protein
MERVGNTPEQNDGDVSLARFQLREMALGHVCSQGNLFASQASAIS